jgi:hypothetical protein
MELIFSFVFLFIIVADAEKMVTEGMPIFRCGIYSVSVLERLFLAEGLEVQGKKYRKKDLSRVSGIYFL